MSFELFSKRRTHRGHVRGTFVTLGASGIAAFSQDCAPIFVCDKAKVLYDPDTTRIAFRCSDDGDRAVWTGKDGRSRINIRDLLAAKSLHRDGSYRYAVEMYEDEVFGFCFESPLEGVQRGGWRVKL